MDIINYISINTIVVIYGQFKSKLVNDLGLKLLGKPLSYYKVRNNNLLLDLRRKINNPILAINYSDDEDISDSLIILENIYAEFKCFCFLILLPNLQQKNKVKFPTGKEYFLYLTEFDNDYNNSKFNTKIIPQDVIKKSKNFKSYNRFTLSTIIILYCMSNNISSWSCHDKLDKIYVRKTKVKDKFMIDYINYPIKNRRNIIFVSLIMDDLSDERKDIVYNTSNLVNKLISNINYDIVTTDDYINNLKDVIQNSQVFIVINTKRYMSSNYLKIQFEYLDKKKTKVIALNDSNNNFETNDIYSKIDYYYNINDIEKIVKGVETIFKSKSQTKIPIKSEAVDDLNILEKIVI